MAWGYLNRTRGCDEGKRKRISRPLVLTGEVRIFFKRGEGGGFSRREKEMGGDNFKGRSL